LKNKRVREKVSMPQVVIVHQSMQN